MQSTTTMTTFHNFFQMWRKRHLDKSCNPNNAKQESFEKQAYSE